MQGLFFQKKRLPHNACHLAISGRKIGMSANLVGWSPLHTYDIIKLGTSQFLLQW